jgi:hypothetical protein
MRPLMAAIAAIAALCLPARAEISSAYTDLKADEHCTVFSAPGGEESDQDWANLVCNGYRGYPIFIYYGDARESAFYGFPPAGDLAPAWESFDGFNSSGDKVEWRLDDASGNTVPFATIHRWFVSGADPDKTTEVLVVSRVAQPGISDGCRVGYVASTGNPKANEQAREIADTRVAGFVCGKDKPVVMQGSVPVPSFHRVEP